MCKKHYGSPEKFYKYLMFNVCVIEIVKTLVIAGFNVKPGYLSEKSHLALVLTPASSAPAPTY